MREIGHEGGTAEIIGIDLGISDVRVARMSLSGVPEITYNAEGNTATPSVVLIENSGEVVVGTEARKMVGLENHNVFTDFKRALGSGHAWQVNGHHITPEQLTTLLLKKVMSGFVQQFGQPQSIAIVWPANFRQEQREATKAAARHAGLHNFYFVEEPIAAALGYAHTTGLFGYYLIYDFGSGTFDVTLIKANGDNISVLNSLGVQQLGGRDMDESLLKIIDRKFRTKTGEQFDRLECSLFDLDVQNAKHTLSVRSSVLLHPISSKHGPVSIEVTREEYESSISHLIDQAEMACESVLCLSQARGQLPIKPSDITDILMVGESCSTPAIQSSVFRMFGKKPVIINPTQVVAMGAAMYAALRTDPQRLSSLQRQALRNIAATPAAPYYFGTSIIDHEMGRLRNQIVISKGENLPCRVTRTYFTARPRQTSITCDLTQSATDESDPDFVCKIIECSLDLPPDTPKGTPITATFECDVEGCASLTLSLPPENGGSSAAAVARVNPPSQPPLADER